MDFPEELQQRLQKAHRIMAFTGAGMSADSGVPTFREAQSGLWAQYRPEEMATPDGFFAHPKRVFDWYTMRYQRASAAQPNAGHRALALLAQRVPHLVIVTQNTDDLHERAGSRKVLHLHGSLMSLRCFDCDNPESWDAALLQRISPPVCLHCGGMLRPATVMFGERLPHGIYEKAHAAASACDLMLVIGTTGLVQPAAQLPYIAKLAGATLVQINPDPLAQGPEFDYRLIGRAAEVLPEFCERRPAEGSGLAGEL